MMICRRSWARVAPRESWDVFLFSLFSENVEKFVQTAVLLVELMLWSVSVKQTMSALNMNETQA